MPFRQAHHVAGRAVRLTGERGVKLSKLTLVEIRGLSELFETDVSEVFGFVSSVARRNADGGTAPEAVKRQIEAAKAWLHEH
jgi:argininosuccinate lyase